MGCAQSRLDNEESVSRCKDRRNLMKQAVMVRNAFASAHSAYAMALKNTGAALSDYAQGEAPPPAQPVVVSEPASEPPPPPPPHMMERIPLPPPPPPLPNFSPVPPLQRAMTMPELSKSRGKMKSIAIDEEEEEEEEDEEGGLKLRNQRNGIEKEGRVDNETPVKTPESPPPPPAGVAWDYFFTVDHMPGTTLGDVEEEDEEEDGYVEENDEGHDSPRSPKIGNTVGDHDGVEEFKTPEKGGMESQMETPVTVKEKHFVHSNTAPPGIRGGFVNGGKVGTANSADFYKVLGEIDDLFLKASECAQEVSKMLEATRMHYHSNFADKGN